MIEPDLAALLAYRRPAQLAMWVDPISPASGLVMPYLDLDGRAHAGRPWRLGGQQAISLRLLPDPSDELSTLTARCVAAVRAWGVMRTGEDDIVPMDYDVPWSYLWSIQRDLSEIHAFGLPHLVALAGREGDWLGDWVAEYHDDPRVHADIAQEASAAHALGVFEAPAVLSPTQVYVSATMPDDIHDRLTADLAAVPPPAPW